MEQQPKQTAFGTNFSRVTGQAEQHFSWCFRYSKHRPAEPTASVSPTTCMAATLVLCALWFWPTSLMTACRQRPSCGSCLVTAAISGEMPLSTSPLSTLQSLSRLGLQLVSVCFRADSAIVCMLFVQVHLVLCVYICVCSYMYNLGHFGMSFCL